MAMYNRHPDPVNGPYSGMKTEEETTVVAEHLGTFNASQHPDHYASLVEGLRRLSQIQESVGISAQKIFLLMERQFLTVLSYETREPIERFPMILIRDPVAFSSKDPNDHFHNVFAFIVIDDSLQRQLPQMHFFHCVRVPASDVVEELKSFMNGSFRPGFSRIPPYPTLQNSISQEHFFGARLRTMGTSPMTSYNAKDAYVLNRCLDDIEMFQGRIQQAEEANRELEDRNRNMKQKKKTQGNGMLMMAAQFPTDHQFHDILQKFKLAFNLLAKVKHVIRDPNAEELALFLFASLHVINKVANQLFPGMNIAARTVFPLLTHNAIELLASCLPREDIDLWQTFGNAWSIPREKWTEGQIPYIPVFSDGWKPDASFFEEKEPVRKTSSHLESFPSSYEPPEVPRDDMYNEPLNKNEAETQEKQSRWLALLKSRNVNIVQVTYPFAAKNEKELTVYAGEYLEVLDDTRVWWKVANRRGRTGCVPHTILTLNYQDINEPSEKKEKPNVKVPIFQHVLLDELMKTAQFQEQRTKLENLKTPEVYISESSTPEEVQEWLRAKKFNEDVQRCFSKFGGKDMFALKRRDLEELIGKDDAHRLDSQLTVQRSFTKYRTARFSDVKKALAKARENAEREDHEFKAGPPKPPKPGNKAPEGK